MSLMLRKQCQSLLDSVSLSNYHVQIDETTKMLQIVGECGQSFVSISGIRLSRMAPNNEEIKLALELFDAFLVKHAGAFKKLVKVKAAAAACKIPTKVASLKKAYVEKQKYNSDWVLEFEMSSRPGKKVKVKSNGEMDIPAMSLFVQNSNKEIMQATLTDKEVVAVTSWVSDCLEYNTATAAEEELLEKLSSCEI